MKSIRYYLCFLGFLMFALLSSCSKGENSNTDTGDPSNLVVEVILPEPGIGTVGIYAYADNAVDYWLIIGSETQPALTSTSGDFEYEFNPTGTYQIEIRAYGTSGRFIKNIKQISLNDNNPVTIGEGYTTPIEYAGFNLVWNDEFDGNALNSQFWSYETGAGGWGNNEKQYYRPDNTSVGDGVLTIEARKESYQNSEYTSSRLVTQGKKSFTYGRVDIRALLPKGQGIWPALWSLGNSFSSVGWPACGEIDIMEMIGGSGREKTVHGTLHWDNNGHMSNGQSYSLNSETFADEYHVFTLIWDETTISWYVNDMKFNEFDITPNHMTEFHLPHFFIFNIAVGGNWPGLPDNTTIFPQQMKVDYIRVFQKNQ